MNRYVVQGLAADAQAGKAVIVCTRTSGLSVHAFADVQDVTKTTKTPDDQRIDFASGGYIRIVPPLNANLRGLSVDVVYLDHGSRGWLNEDALAAVALRGGEVICA